MMEIANEDINFIQYLNKDFVITETTLVKFFIVLLREGGEKVADYWFRKLEGYSVPVDKYVLKEAMKFKYEHKKQRISFFDAVGYIFSVKNGYLFVTGDKEFENLKNVEFRKK